MKTKRLEIVLARKGVLHFSSQAFGWMITLGVGGLKRGAALSHWI